MVKTQCCLWVDSDLKEAAKAQNINLSELMENAIKTSLGMVDLTKKKKEELIKERTEVLKEATKHNAKIAVIESKIKELEQLEKENEPKIKKRIFFD